MKVDLQFKKAEHCLMYTVILESLGFQEVELTTKNDCHVSFSGCEQHDFISDHTQAVQFRSYEVGILCIELDKLDKYFVS